MEYWYITYITQGPGSDCDKMASTVHEGTLTDWIMRVSKHPESYHILYSHRITKSEYNELFIITG